jgi:hypothetical protein
VRQGRSFDEVAAQNAADAASAGVQYYHLQSIENIARSNYRPGTFLACILDGEPHAIAMPEEVDPEWEPTLKRTVEGGACIFRAQYYAMPQYPVVHIGLGLPIRFLEGSKVAFAIVESVADFTEGNYQDWVLGVQEKKHTVVDVFAPDFRLIATGLWSERSWRA